MGSITCEIFWVLKILYDFGLKNLVLVNVFYDNDYAIKLAQNPVFHDKTKHFEDDVHFCYTRLLVNFSPSHLIFDFGSFGPYTGCTWMVRWA